MVTAVPNNVIIPFFGIAFDGSMSGAASSVVPVNLLCLGQRLIAGTIPEATPYRASSADEVGLKSGYGSMHHLQAIMIFKNNQTVPVTFVSLDDASGSSAATHAWDLTGTATASGEYVRYIGARRYAVGVAIGDTGESLQGLMAAKFTDDTGNLPCTASATTNTLTLTMKNKGIAAGDLDTRSNANSGEVIPSGLTLSAVTTVAGTVDPDVTDALAVLGDAWYQLCAQPYTDNTNMNELEEYASLVDTGMVMRDIVFHQALRATRSAMITYGEDTANRNSQHMVMYPAYRRMVSTYELSAAIAAAKAVSVQEDPSQPPHRISIKGIPVLADQDRWESNERNELAVAGISTLTDDIGVQTEACITMYLKNSAGADDGAFKQEQTVYTLSEARYSLRNLFQTKYARAKLADNDDNADAEQLIMTPTVGRNECIAWFKELQKRARFDPSNEALEQFKTLLVVRRADTSVNPNRLDFLLPPKVIGQFIVGAFVLQFRL